MEGQGSTANRAHVSREGRRVCTGKKKNWHSQLPPKDPKTTFPPPLLEPCRFLEPTRPSRRQTLSSHKLHLHNAMASHNSSFHHWVLLLHFVITIKCGKCIEGSSDTFIYFFISHLFTMHLDHLQPEQHIFTVDLAVCFAGIKFHNFLCIFLAIIFPYLRHIEARKLVILVNLEII